jgi:hypothetical protein
MKKIIYPVLILFALVFSSCDYVSNVIEPSSNNGGGNTDTTKTYRKVLVEDYTGHKCGNCPAAANELKKLDSIYHGKIVPLAVHAGFFANINATYTTDFRTPEGTTFDTDFGVSVAGNPNGLINRSGYGTPDFIRAWTTWETALNPIVSQEADFKIEIANTYASGTKQVTSAITVKALKALTGNYKLSVLIAEDSIISKQLDYSLPSGQQLVTDYNFMHVLRGSLNSAYGEQAWNGSVASGANIVKTYSNFQLANNYIAKNCHIIAFIYNADNTSTTYREVLQAEMKRVTE